MLKLRISLIRLLILSMFLLPLVPVFAKAAYHPGNTEIPGPGEFASMEQFESLIAAFPPFDSQVEGFSQAPEDAEEAIQVAGCTDIFDDNCTRHGRWGDTSEGFPRRRREEPIIGIPRDRETIIRERVIIIERDRDDDPELTATCTYVGPLGYWTLTLFPRRWYEGEPCWIQVTPVFGVWGEGQ